MLPARHRLRRSADFTATLRRGRAAPGPLVHLHLLRRPDGERAGEPALVGLAVSRAVGDAVTRHRVQRRLRHLLHDRLDLLPPGSHLVVRATPAAAEAGSDALAADLDAQLARLLPAHARA